MIPWPKEKPLRRCEDEWVHEYHAVNDRAGLSIPLVVGGGVSPREKLNIKIETHEKQ